MQDAASEHDVRNPLHAPLPARIANDCKARLKNAETPLHILPACFLPLRKVFPLLVLRVVDALHKATPLWVNTISQQVVAVVQLAVYLKCHVTCCAAQQVMDQGGPIQDIKVIVQTW